MKSLCLSTISNLNLSTGWRWIHSFALRPFITGEGSYCTYRPKEWVGPRVGLDVVAKITFSAPRKECYVVSGIRYVRKIPARATCRLVFQQPRNICCLQCFLPSSWNNSALSGSVPSLLSDMHTETCWSRLHLEPHEYISDANRWRKKFPISHPFSF